MNLSKADIGFGGLDNCVGGDNAAYRMDGQIGGGLYTRAHATNSLVLQRGSQVHGFGRRGYEAGRHEHCRGRAQRGALGAPPIAVQPPDDRVSGAERGACDLGAGLSGPLPFLVWTLAWSNI